jgi:hypothetical protein
MSGGVMETALLLIMVHFWQAKLLHWTCSAGRTCTATQTVGSFRQPDLHPDR